MVTIEESDDEKSIVTPDLRLRFRWTVDRWTHAIEFGPAPSSDVALAVEWDADGSPAVLHPTYQELHFQTDGSDVVALLVGQAGPHHFSASMRVAYRGFRYRFPQDLLTDRSASTVEFDVADRCRVTPSPLWASYRLIRPSENPATDESESRLHPTFATRWLSSLMIPADYDETTSVGRVIEVNAISGEAEPRPSLKVSQDGTSMRLDCTCPESQSAGTRRIRYRWSQHRDYTLRPDEMGAGDPPWSLASSLRTVAEVQAIPPHDCSRRVPLVVPDQ